MLPTGPSGLSTGSGLPYPPGQLRTRLSPTRWEWDDLRPAEAFRQAILESERTRILCLLSILAIVLMLVATRALTTGISEQQALLPRFIALISVSAAYEGLMLALVRRAIRRDSDLPDWAWF